MCDIEEGHDLLPGTATDGADGDLADRLAGDGAGDLSREIDLAEDADAALVEGAPLPWSARCACSSG